MLKYSARLAVNSITLVDHLYVVGGSNVANSIGRSSPKGDIGNALKGLKTCWTCFHGIVKGLVKYTITRSIIERRTGKLDVANILIVPFVVIIWHWKVMYWASDAEEFHFHYFLII
jgi:hypothetical protein